MIPLAVSPFILHMAIGVGLIITTMSLFFASVLLLEWILKK